MKIKDPLIEPYFVNVTEEQFILMETKPIDTTHHMSKGEEGEREVPVGYFVDFAALLKRIVFLKKAKQEVTVDLATYIKSVQEDYEAISKEIEYDKLVVKTDGLQTDFSSEMG